MTLALLCSGQGGQHAGMFDLTGDEPACADLFRHASGLLGHDPRTWARNADAAVLRTNRNAQLLCALQALAVAAALPDVVPDARCIAGYSIGEVAAWGVAGAMRPLDVLDLVVARADAMDAARATDQGMLFVRGLARAEVDALCRDRDAAIAIASPGDACVIGGARDALDHIAGEAAARGAARIVPVGVEVASHTSLMADAVPPFRRALAGTVVDAKALSRVRLVSGIDGTTVLEAATGIEKLALQVARTVEWAACIETCIEAGADVFLELGPGRALAEMASAAHAGIAARSVDEFRSLAGVRTWLDRSST